MWDIEELTLLKIPNAPHQGHSLTMCQHKVPIRPMSDSINMTPLGLAKVNVNVNVKVNVNVPKKFKIIIILLDLALNRVR